MPERDYYEVLGIGHDSGDSKIKRAYRTLAMKYHPDRNPGDSGAAQKMKGINEAYAVLSDSKKRRLYDTYGLAGLEGYTQDDIVRDVDFSSLFREFGLGDIFGFDDSVFGDLFGRSTTRRQGSRRGADLRYDLETTLEEVARGVERTLEIPRATTCPGCRGTGAEAGGLKGCESCRGSGQIVREQRAGPAVLRQITVCSVCRGSGSTITEVCKTCEGKGAIQETAQIKVTIPPGAESGHALRVPGEGEAGEDLPGDLYVVLNVKKHPIFERHGDDIYLQQDIDFTTAALGGEIEVPSLNGNIPLEIPEGTQTSATFRVQGRGLPRLDGYGKGDEYVVFKVVTPTDLSPKEKELLRQLQQLRSTSGGNDHE